MLRYSLKSLLIIVLVGGLVLVISQGFYRNVLVPNISLVWPDLKCAEVNETQSTMLISTEFEYSANSEDFRDRLDTPQFRKYVFDRGIKLRRLEVGLDPTAEPGSTVFDAVRRHIDSHEQTFVTRSCVLDDSSYIPLELFVLVRSGDVVVCFDARKTSATDIVLFLGTEIREGLPES